MFSSSSSGYLVQHKIESIWASTITVDPCLLYNQLTILILRPNVFICPDSDLFSVENVCFIFIELQKDWVMVGSISKKVFVDISGK